MAAIAKLGYEAKEPAPAPPEIARSTLPAQMPVPADAPRFFVEAVKRARAAKRPLIIDFWAEWCVACLRLKHETLEKPEVVEALRSVEMIYVDLDKYPALGDAYGVAAIPDVFFVDGSGRIVDRFQDFEPPEIFIAHVRRVFDQSVNSDTVASRRPHTGNVGDVTVLSESIEPLREHFNAHKDKYRLIAILSPT